MDINELGLSAKKASSALAEISGKTKNDVLLCAAKLLKENYEEIISANNIDIENAEKSGISNALIDRLRLTKQRICDMAKGLEELAAENDPIGNVVTGFTSQNGLEIKKVRVPLGVIGIIYEARPNVTSDAFGICLKSGNSVILRGGKEAINSNIAIIKVLKSAVSQHSLPEGTVNLIEDTSRKSAEDLMKLKYLDLLIPRGGASLIRSTLENAKVPVIQTGEGNCHVYVDYTADIEMAADIVENGKCSRPSVCNAVETLLIDRSIAEKALPVICDRLKKHGTEIRGCSETCKMISDAVLAKDEDFATEFLDYVISVKIVENIDEAIEHIRKYSTGHSECIVTNSYSNSQKFVSSIDSAALYVNASTRFTDGGQFGMGAEIGISTGRLHARGPMGVNELTTVKYIIHGNGQIR